MSIISSTNTGKKGVKITEDFLLKRGYFFKVTPLNTKYRRMYYDDKKFVMIEKYSDDSDCLVYVSIENNPTMMTPLFYHFPINNFEDLLLVESYWKATTQKRRQKYKKQMLNKKQIKK